AGTQNKQIESPSKQPWIPACAGMSGSLADRAELNRDDTMPKHRCAILDDYQNVALKLADWSKVKDDLDIKVFTEHLGFDNAAIARARGDSEVMCAMRGPTPSPKELIEALPNLKLLIPTGMVTRGIDGEAAKAKGITVCGPRSFGNPTAVIAWGHI